MVDFKKSKSGSFMQKRKRELENVNTGTDLDDFTAPVAAAHTAAPRQEETGPEVPAEKENRIAGETAKSGGEPAPEKKKNVLRKTVAIDEDIFTRLQLIKAYHRIDHQDIIILALSEFLEAHTDNGRIKESDIESILNKVKDLKN